MVGCDSLSFVTLGLDSELSNGFPCLPNYVLFVLCFLQMCLWSHIFIVRYLHGKERVCVCDHVPSFAHYYGCRSWVVSALVGPTSENFRKTGCAAQGYTLTPGSRQQLRLFLQGVCRVHANEDPPATIRQVGVVHRSLPTVTGMS